MKETLAETIARLDLPELPEPLPVPTIDSHTHLDSTIERNGLSLEQLIEAAKSVNIVKMVQIGCDVESSKWAVDCAEKTPEVIASVAIHPNDAARAGDDLDSMIAEIDRLAGSGPRVRAVGETGLDYFRTTDPAGHELQKYSFEKHIEITKKHDLTLVIHDRDAHGDILEVLDQVGAPDRVIMHCFSGDYDFARDCVARGYYISYPGTVTFKNAKNLRRALVVTPLENLLVETDAPYLTPMPYRGRKNASYLVPWTVRFMAEQIECDLGELCEQLRVNAETAYGGAW